MVVAGLVVLVLVLGGGHQLDHVGRVHDLRVGRVGVDRLVDGGLEVVLESTIRSASAMVAVCLMSRDRSCGSVPGPVRLVTSHSSPAT